MADDSNLIEKIMELGIGVSFAKQVPNLLSQCMPKAQTPSPPRPQVAESVFYLVVDNAQAGPFKQEDIQLLVKKGLIKPDTLVWKTGMPQWLPASQVPEINKMFIMAKI